MNTYTERKLKQIREIGHSKNMIISCDIYYDDIKEQFVVLIRSYKGKVVHFRSNHIRKSLREALKYVKSL